MENLYKRKDESSKAIRQMAEYLKDYQSVIDFQLKEIDKRNMEMMRELKVPLTRLSALVDPEIVGAYRGGTAIISNESNPVFNLSKSIPINYAQDVLQTVYNNAYYRIGYLSAFGTSFVSINDSYSGVTFPDTRASTQTLSLVSSSAQDKGTPTVGTGVQMVLVGGIGSDGKRLSEPVTLNGTGSATTSNQFAQIDSFFTIAAGTSAAAVGTITAEGSSDSTIYAAIQPGYNNWNSGCFFTDSLAAGYVDSWAFASYTSTVRGQLRTDAISSEVYAFISRASCIVENSTVQLTFPVPIRVIKQGMVIVRGIAKQTTTDVTTNFEMHFVTE